MRATQNIGTWSDLPAEVLEDALYEPSSDDLLDLLLDYGQHLYTRDKVASRTVMAAYRRIAHLEKKLEALTEQRDEARRDAVEAEAYVGEVETNLAKAVEALKDIASEVPANPYEDTICQDQARAALDAVTITSTETWVNGKTGAYT